MTSKLDTAGLAERDHDPKLVEALKTIKTKLEALPESLRGPFIVEGLAPYSLTQAAAPDIAPVAYRWTASDINGDDWPWTYTGKAGAEIHAAHGHTIEPLYSASQLSALQERVDALDAECQQFMLDICRERERAEAAEARVADLTEALTPSADTKAAYWGEFYMGVTLRAGSEEEIRRVQIPWDSIKEIMAAIRARAALAHKGEGR